MTVIYKKEKAVHVIFCLIQSVFGNNSVYVKEEYHLNQVIYNLQVQLQNYRDKMRAQASKEFVYGNRDRLYTIPISEAPIEQIFYADSTIFAREKKKLFDEYKSIESANAAHILLLADKMAKQYSNQQQNTQLFLLIVSERQLTAEEIRQFKCTIRGDIPYQIILIEKRKYHDEFEKYINEINGKVYSFQEVIKNECKI